MGPSSGALKGQGRMACSAWCFPAAPGSLPLGFPFFGSSSASKLGILKGQGEKVDEEKGLWSLNFSPCLELEGSQDS